MPHCIVEYSDNIAGEAAIPALLAKLAAQFRASGGVFPEAGVRVRAWPVRDYLIADGNPDHAFVNVTVRIGAGRPRDFQKRFFDETFEILRHHFDALSARRGLGLTLYVEEADPDLSWKANSIRAHMRTA